MKGLELSRDFYNHMFLPLATSSGLSEDDYAAGLVGEGSECFGFDDEFSRDHDWGAGFCIWLRDDVSEREAERYAEIIRQLPKEYGDFPVKSFFGPLHRAGIFTVSGFYSMFTGLAHMPSSNAEWLSIGEPMLASATNGEIFSDIPALFSACRKKLLDYYPRDVWLRKLAENSAMAAQTGQYNYLRCINHGEYMAAEIAKGRFIEAASQLTFLLNRIYRPFYKWTFRAMRKLPWNGDKMSELLMAYSKAEKYDAAVKAEEIAGMLIGRMNELGISSCNDGFLMSCCKDLINEIEDAELRKKPLSLVF